jgi:hypothetical protein
MGSFNSACIVSGLPIEAGDKVRFLVLARSALHPDGNDHPHYVNGRWQLFGVPVRAEYNDYGSVENIEDGYAKSFLLSRLKAHSVEIGVGDNQCHDSEVVEEMDEESWLDALWEGRVRVRECRPRSPGGDSRWEPTAGVPTFKRIKEALASAGHPVRSRDQPTPGFLVDDASPGFVRVRCGGYGEGLDIVSVIPALQEAGYAVMTVAGSGSYASRAELLVGPLPPKDDNVHIRVRPYGSEEEIPHTMAVRPASQAMIREDVWQLLLSLPGWADKTVEDMRADALRALEEDRASSAGGSDDDKEIERLSRRLRAALGDRDEGPPNFFREVVRDGRTGTVGFGLQDAFEAAQDPRLDPEKAKRFVQDIAETAFAQFAYGSLHGQWQPRSGGGQEANWGGFHDYLRKLADIASSKVDEEIYGEGEGDFEEPEDEGDYDEPETLE